MGAFGGFVSGLGKPFPARRQRREPETSSRIVGDGFDFRTRVAARYLSIVSRDRIEAYILRTTAWSAAIGLRQHRTHAERTMLLGPLCRQTHHAGKTDPSGQASLGDGLDEIRGEESER